MSKVLEYLLCVLVGFAFTFLMATVVIAVFCFIYMAWPEWIFIRVAVGSSLITGLWVATDSLMKGEL